jgi:hypothetical protein
LRYLGAITGEPKSALSLLKSGFWVGVYPGNITLVDIYFKIFHSGGVDECMIGHENAYKVYWPKTRELFFKMRIFH